MIEFTEQQLKDVKDKGEELYKSIDQVYSPYFREKISFGVQGLEHLKFKRREKACLDKDQYMRFKLLHLAPKILKLSYTIQGVLETNKFERVRMHSRTD